MLKTKRISHPAFSGSRRDETIAFYRDLLGMEVVLLQGNLDVPEEDHFFFHVGEDNFIAYFLPKPGVDTKLPPARSGSGWMDHLALDVEPGAIEAWCARLGDAGVEFEGPIDRGYERSVYFKDPNGVTIELLSWLTPLPEGLPQAVVIRAAQVFRELRGADYIEDRDVQDAVRGLR
ncbi:MAG: VOC family protein [Chloroflexi bacterium]|nr:VOC family protein [Chloroflexota bacterium]